MDLNIDKFIKKYDIEIPEHINTSHKSIYIALDNGDTNLVKSIIVYKNYIKNRDKDLDLLEQLLDKD
jgi:hypothetical protein